MTVSADDRSESPGEPASLADVPTAEVAAVLRLRAAQRRASGVYPPLLDDDMHRWSETMLRTSGLASQGASIDERVMAIEELVGRVLALNARVEQLEAAEQERRFRPTYAREAFEARFRGARDEIVRAVGDLADEFVGARGPVVDVGCGRGELLVALRERAVASYGVDSDARVVQEVCDRGLDARLADGVSHVRGCSAATLGGVAMLQVIEHLTPQQQLDIVTGAAAAIEPGGRIVIETVNPMSLYVFAHALYLDPTHTQPVHPLYLQFVMEQAGFGDVRLEWRSPVSPAERLPLDAFGPHADPNIITRLNDMLYGAQDYALIGTRA